jgi:hypothetical protein
VNRREFIRNSLVAGTTGIPGGELFAEHPKLSVVPNESTSKRLVYSHLIDPREHPDYTRRLVQPPSWETFGGQVHFTALREFAIKDGRIVGFVEEIEKYTQKYQLGDVLWIRYPILFASNLGDLLDEIQRRKLFLFDIWGYVPGSGPGGPWQQFQPPPGVFHLIESRLGDHWLGMDNGEQDGRYLGSYAIEFYPSSSDRFEQYLNFHRHFERLTGQLGNKMAALVSMNFGHYFLKEGLYTLIGAETAQGLPNAQVYYSFIRGAGKQYGVLWFGNASVYNRWGWKHYGRFGSDHDSGPNRGASLSLMKRLMYSQLLYNSVLVGFESGFLTCGDAPGTANVCAEEALSPIGLMQQAAGIWLREAGNPGPMLTPFALMMDFFAGWAFPRRDPSSPVYRVWGNVPYAAGDYLTDGIVNMLYPGYQDSSFFQDERGFVTPTPYGDGADCLLTDAPGWLLTRYAILLIAGEVQGGAELHDKLESYVLNGGHLLITSGNLAKFPQGLAGVQAKPSSTHFAAGTRVRTGETQLNEGSPFDIFGLTFPNATRILAESSSLPVVIEVSFGRGRLTVFASPFGVAAEKADGPPDRFRSELDQALTTPYPLLGVMRFILDRVFRSQMLFEVGDELSLITCRNAPGEYTLGVSNPHWRSQPFKIVSRCGPISSIRELTLDQSERAAVGYVPEILEKADLGASDDANIAGGDIRIFSVKVSEQRVEEIAHVVPPPRPQLRALPLRDGLSIKQEILARPSFFEHFDSVVLDWRYLQQREKAQLERETEWIHLQKLNLLVDLTSGINLFPDLRFVDNSRQDYLSSSEAIADVIGKMAIVSARDLIVSLHKYPENNFTEEQSWQSFEGSLRQLCRLADKQGIKVHLRLRLSTPPKDLSSAIQLMDRVNAANFRLAPATAFLSSTMPALSNATKLLKGKVGLWLVNQAETDVAGYVWNENAPICGYRDPQSLANLLAIAPEAPVIFDVVYKDHDEEYLDAVFLRGVLAPGISATLS